MTDAVDYMIEDKASYSGNIGCIMEKNTLKKWVSDIPLQMISISLKLKNPTYISRIECKGNQTEIIEVTFKDIDKEPIDSTILNFEYTKDDCIMRNIEQKQRTAFIDLKLRSNNGKPKPMGLNFIIFRGNQNPLKPTKEKITNLTKEHNIDKLQLDTFKAPTKAKPIQASRPYRNVPLPSKFPFNQRQKRNQNQKQPDQKSSRNEDIQYQKAIKESQRTYKEEQMKMKTLKDKNSQLQIQNDKDDSDTMPLAPSRKYQVAPLSEMIDCFKFVNSKWLEAQKRAEQQLGVKEQEKLSNYIQIKYLLNKDIYIDSESIKGQRKAKLQNIAEKLGAKVINAPKKYCIFISTSWDNSSVQKAIDKFSNIKAVNEDYLIDCIKLNAELDWKDYSLKK